MDWLKKHYDLALLAAATLLVAGTSTYIALQASAPSFTTPTPPTPDNTIPAAPTDPITAANTLAAQPPLWQTEDDRGSLLVSRTYILKDGQLIDPIEGSEQLHPPITNEWLLANELDYSDPAVKEADPDGDEFSNLEEFTAGTDPNNPASTPPSFTKLRLLRFEQIPFRLEFKGDPTGEGEQFQVNLKDLKGRSRTQYRKKGEPIEGAPYKVVSYEAKSETTDAGLVRNTSILTVQNTDTGATIVLPFDTEINDPTSYGEFLNLLDNSTLRLKQDQEFTLDPDPAKLKLIDISESSAQIQNIATGETHRVLSDSGGQPAMP
jgi:hypothetical protein